jgi:DNA repair protein RadA/Sms
MNENETSVVEIVPSNNILDVVIPPPLETVVSVGLSFVNDSLGQGGMTPSTTMLLTGTPGAGKTTLCLQMADAITAQGNIAIFNSAEESKFQIRKVAKRLNLKHGFIWGEITNVSQLLKFTAQEWKKGGLDKQIFLFYDSMQMLEDTRGRDTSAAQLEAVRTINDFCKETYAIAIIIGQVTKAGVFEGKNKVKHSVDVHAHFYIDDDRRSETYDERLFEVQKNRFGGAGRCYVLGVKAEGVYEKGNFDMVAGRK